MCTREHAIVLDAHAATTIYMIACETCEDYPVADDKHMYRANRAMACPAAWVGYVADVQNVANGVPKQFYDRGQVKLEWGICVLPLDREVNMWERGKVPTAVAAAANLSKPTEST